VGKGELWNSLTIEQSLYNNGEIRTFQPRGIWQKRLSMVQEEPEGILDLQCKFKAAQSPEKRKRQFNQEKD